MQKLAASGVRSVRSVRTVSVPRSSVSVAANLRLWSAPQAPLRRFSSDANDGKVEGAPDATSSAPQKKAQKKKSIYTAKRPPSADQQLRMKKDAFATRQDFPVPKERLPAVKTEHFERVKDCVKPRIVAGVILERLPLVAPDFSDAEGQYHYQRMQTIEEMKVAQDKIADNYVTEQQELLQPKKKKPAKKKAKGGEQAKKVDDGDEDNSDDEVESVKTFSLETPDEGNQKSLYRKLTQRLYLIVKKDRAQHSWQFMQGPHIEEDGDHLRKTAERQVQTLIPGLDTFFVGNTPMTWYAYKLPEAEQKKYDGADAAHAFFYKAQYLFGEVAFSKESGIVDYAWCTRAELKDYLDAEYLAQIDHALLN